MTQDETPVQQADMLVDLLAKLHDSGRILKSNQNAAKEALATVEKARKEAASIEDGIVKRKADADAQLTEATENVAKMRALAEDIHKQAHVKHDLHVATAEAKGRTEYDKWISKAKAAELLHAEKHQLLEIINKEVDKRQAVLNRAKEEMRQIRLKLDV